MKLRSLHRHGLGLALALLAWSTIASPNNFASFSRSTADLQAEAQAAGREGKQLAIFLTLPDCPGCLEMERSVFVSPDLSKALHRKFRTVRLDIAQTGPLIDPAGKATAPQEFAQRLRAFATPSYAFFDAGGQTLYRYTGTLDKTGFAQLANYVAAGRYEQRPFSAPGGKVSAPQLQAEPPGATLPSHPEFSLAGTDGQPHRLADFRGLAVALAVGYTQCPDVCPTTLAEMQAAVESLLPALRPRVQLLFATLDPERDGLPLLKEYMSAFRPAGGRPILGLRGNPVETANLVRQLQLVAEKQTSASMGYTLDHTAGVFLFDERGRLRGMSPYGTPLKNLSSDLTTLAAMAQAKRPPHLAHH